MTFWEFPKEFFTKEHRTKLAGAILVLILFSSLLTGSGMFPHTSSSVIGFDEERAYTDAKNIMGGPRLTGDTSESKTAAYIKKQFEAAGLEAHVEKYKRPLFAVRSASLSMISYLQVGIPDPRRQPVEFDHLSEYAFFAYSPSRKWSSPSDDLEVYDLGDGKKVRWEGISGKAVIINDHAVNAREAYLKAWRGGAKAVFLVNDKGRYSGLPYSGASISPWRGFENPADIPLISLSGTAGAKMRELAERGYRVRLDCEIVIKEKYLHVVVGEKKGRVRPEDLFIIGAHHDTVYNSPGAVDNGAGVVTVLELARQLGKRNPKSTVRLITFGGEEEGIFGSYAYWEAHKDMQERVKFYVNLDMPDINPERARSAHFLIGQNETIPEVNAIWEEVKKSRPELASFNVTPIWYNLEKVNSDQQVFARNGIPCGYSAGGGMRYKHTYMDTIEEVTPLSWAVSGSVWGTFVLRHADT